MRSQIRHVDIAHVPTPLPHDLVVLDVREADEWEAGHIEGALHVPLMQLPTRVDDIPRDTEVLVVCKVGARSAQAAAFLQAHGRDVVNLQGGMLAWARVGRPMVSASDGAPPAVA